MFSGVSYIHFLICIKLLRSASSTIFKAFYFCL
nr:MAG TPA: hypothetical protein [Caudoviricetes sp.]